MLAYIDKVIKPYINSVSPDGKTALCLFDTFAAHKTESVKAKLESLNIKHVFIPPGCTGELQPLDLTALFLFSLLVFSASSSSWSTALLVYMG